MNAEENARRALAAVHMPRIAVRVDVQIANFDELDLDGVEQRVRQALATAALSAVDYVRGLWINVAQDCGAHDIGQYIEGIRGASAEIVEGPAGPEAGVFDIELSMTNNAKHASIVEDGHQAFHLPSRINWSGGKVKQGKHGPYLHIPFRHTAHVSPEEAIAKGYTRSAMSRMMPSDVYAAARKLKSTARQNVGPVRSGTGQFMAFDRYNWGGRLHRGDVGTGLRGVDGSLHRERRGETTIRPGSMRPGGRAAIVNPEWQASKFEGVFKAGGGRGRHSQYMTIRTITPNSKGWNIPAQVGRGVVRQVAANLSSDPYLNELLRAAIEAAVSGGNTP